MDPAFFTPDDIWCSPCAECGSEIEFWKDDVTVVCPECKKENVNPRLNRSCVSWCKNAQQCIGNSDITKWKKRTRGNSVNE
jgi:hypothetical protein